MRYQERNVSLFCFSTIIGEHLRDDFAHTRLYRFSPEETKEILVQEHLFIVKIKFQKIVGYSVMMRNVFLYYNSEEKKNYLLFFFIENSC